MAYYPGAGYPGSYFPGTGVTVLPEYIDFVSNLVRDVMGVSAIDRVAEHGVVLTTAVAGDVVLTRLHETTTRVLVDELLEIVVER